MVSEPHELDYIIEFACGCRVTLFYLDSYQAYQVGCPVATPWHAPTWKHVDDLVEMTREAMRISNEQQELGN